MLEYLGLIVLCIVGGGFVLYIRKLQILEKENAILQNKITQTQRFYDEMQERVDGIRKYRHDLQKHIRIVEQFLDEGRQFETYQEYQELQNYIREMQEDIENTRHRRFCQDELINAICEIKTEECREKNIPFAVRIEITEESTDGIDPFYLTGILMNLLDNATEAQQKREKGADQGILLHLSEGREGLRISVGNDVPDDFTLSFRTTKANKEEHGLGLGIARDYAARYGGQLDLDYDEEKHYLTIRTELHMSQDEGGHGYQRRSRDGKNRGWHTGGPPLRHAKVCESLCHIFRPA